MKKIAIITARGGSKRIPRKNIKDFCGKPIIAYSIEAAMSSGLFDEVMVSTDDEEIKSIAIKYGASVPFLRSKKTSDDMTPTYEVLLEVLREYEKIGKQFDIICCIYPTAPFITAERLREAENLLFEKGADGIVPVVSYSFPPQRCFVITNDKIKYKWPENKLARSQDLEKWYHDAGQFYMVRTKAFLQYNSLIVENTIPLMLNELEVQDIDNDIDWKLAEMKFRLIHTMHK